MCIVIKCQLNLSPTNCKLIKLIKLVTDELMDRNCECCVTCCIDYEGWLQFQNCLYGIVKDPLFELFITTCIVLNTLFLALEHHGMSENVRSALDIGNKVSWRQALISYPEQLLLLVSQHCSRYNISTQFKC